MTTGEPDTALLDHARYGLHGIYIWPKQTHAFCHNFCFYRDVMWTQMHTDLSVSPV